MNTDGTTSNLRSKDQYRFPRPCLLHWPYIDVMSIIGIFKSWTGPRGRARQSRASLSSTHDFTIYGRCWHTPFCYRHRAKTAKSATRIYSSVVHWLIAFRYLKGRKTLQLRLKGIRACTTHRRFAVCSWIQHTDNSKDNLYSGVSVSLSTSYLIQGWTHNIRWSSLNWIFVCLFVVSRK